MAALAPVLKLFPVLIRLAHTAEKDLLSLPVFAACQAVKLDGLPEGSKRPWGALAMHRAAKQNPAQLWCAQPLSGVVPWQLGLVGSPKPPLTGQALEVEESLQNCLLCFFGHVAKNS